jgi:hypothetical protein
MIRKDYYEINIYLRVYIYIYIYVCIEAGEGGRGRRKGGGEWREERGRAKGGIKKTRVQAVEMCAMCVCCREMRGGGEGGGGVGYRSRLVVGATCQL